VLLLAGYNSIAVLSIAGRLSCDGDAPLVATSTSADPESLHCEQLRLINTITCGLEIAFSFFLLLALRSFKSRARRLADGGRADLRVQAQNYTVRLQGLPPAATPLAIKAHVEASLSLWAETKVGCLAYTRYCFVSGPLCTNP